MESLPGNIHCDKGLQFFLIRKNHPINLDTGSSHESTMVPFQRDLLYKFIMSRFIGHFTVIRADHRICENHFIRFNVEFK